MAAPGEEDIFHHVRDFPYFHLPSGYAPLAAGLQAVRLPLPVDQVHGPAGRGRAVRAVCLSRIVASDCLRPGGPRRMVELLGNAGALYPRQRRAADDRRRRTPRTWRALGTMSMVTKIMRTRVTVPNITTFGHPADKYLPYVWTCFFYVLICNLLGAFPWLGSPTGEINVTGRLAVVTVGDGHLLRIAAIGLRRLLAVVGSRHGSVAGDEGHPGSRDLDDRTGRVRHQARRVGHSSFCQHDGRPHRHGGHHAVYRDGGPQQQLTGCTTSWCPRAFSARSSSGRWNCCSHLCRPTFSRSWRRCLSEWRFIRTERNERRSRSAASIVRRMSRLIAAVARGGSSD